MSEILEIENRLRLITSGGWYSDCTPNGPSAARSYKEAVLSTASYPHKIVCKRATHDCGNSETTYNDMVFIANAPKDIRFLLERIAVLEAECEFMQRQLG